MGVDEPTAAEIMRSQARLEAGLERIENKMTQYLRQDVYFADKETQSVRWQSLAGDVESLKADRSKFFYAIGGAFLGLVVMALFLFLQAGG